MKNLSALILCLLLPLLSACSQTPPEVASLPEAVVVERQTTVEVTREVTREIEVTRIIEMPVTEEVTRLVEKLVTLTPLPPTPTSQPQEGLDVIARNYVASQDSGGVVIQIGRALIARKSVIDQEFTRTEQFRDKDVLGMLIFVITNNTSSTVRIYPGQGTVQVGAEQIELLEYSFGGGMGDSLGGDIFPGVTKIGGYWFGIARSELEEVTEMIFRARGPYSDSSRLGPDYEIRIDLSERVFEPLPIELTR
jgi:hypothetical protein